MRGFVGLALACAFCLSAPASPAPTEPSASPSWSDLREGPAELLKLEVVKGGFPHEAIAELLREKAKPLFVCYLTEVADRESPGDGVITIAFEMDSTGSVVDAGVAATDFGTRLDECLLTKVRHWSLPETDGGPTRILFSMRAREEPALELVCDGGLRGHMVHYVEGGMGPSALETQFQPRPGPANMLRPPASMRNVCDDLPRTRKPSDAPALPK